MINENWNDNSILNTVFEKKSMWEKIVIIYCWKKYSKFSKVDNKTDYLRLIDEKSRSIFVKISEINESNILFENINPIEIDIKTKIEWLLWDSNESSRFSINWTYGQVYYKRNDSTETSLDIVTLKNWRWDKHYIIENEEIRVWKYGNHASDILKWEVIDKEENDELLKIIDSSSTLLTEKKDWKRTVEYPGIEQDEVISYKNKNFTTIDWKLTWNI